MIDFRWNVPNALTTLLTFFNESFTLLLVSLSCNSLDPSLSLLNERLFIGDVSILHIGYIDLY